MLALAVSTLFISLAQTVEVRLAPDQPAPIFFTDEPLVVQVRADGDAAIDLDIDVDLPDGRVANWKQPALALKAGAAKWLTMDGLPTLRGPHVFHIHTAADAPPVDRTLARIDRPVDRGAANVVLALSAPSAAARYAAQCIGAGIELPLATPDLETQVTAFDHPGRGPVYVRITASNGRHPRSVEAGVSALRDRVDLWTVDGAISPRESVREGMAVRQRDPGAAWAPQMDDAREVAGLLQRGGAPIPAALVTNAAQAETIVVAAARAGLEQVPLIVDAGTMTAATTPQQALRVLLDVAMSEDRTLRVPQSLIESPTGFSGALAVLAAARNQFDGARSIGTIAMAGDNRADVVRLGPGAAQDAWVVVITVNDAATPLPAIEVGDGAAWALLDSFGNPLGNAAGTGAIAAPGGTGAWFVRGHGGTLMRDALAARVRAMAKAAEVHLEELTVAAPDAIDSLTSLATYEAPAPVRLQFFSLLRALPAIEENWRRGIVDTRHAIPMERDFSAIAEVLAMLEQELNEPLLEPLGNTLQTCSEWLAKYPVPAGPDPRDADRIAFLRREVRQLSGQARAWENAGRMTEAKAVAAIAEWRARSLESAATVPWPEGRASEEIDNETAAPGAPAEESGDEPEEGVDE